MRQALKTNWQIDLPEAHGRQAAPIAPAPAAPPAPVAPVAARPVPTPPPAPVATAPVAPAPNATATVVPFGHRRVLGGDHGPEVAEVLSALSRAAQEIRQSDGRASQAEAAQRDAASRLHATEERARVAEERVSLLEEQVKIAEGNLRLTERKFQQVSDWQAQQVAETEAELDRLRAAVETAQARVVELEGAAIEQDTAMKAIIEDAGNRLFSAETRANEAARDFEALRDFIRTNFVG